MNKAIFSITYLFFYVTLLTSCKLVKPLLEIHKAKAKVYSYSLEDKEIKFIPMHHVGKKSFYEDVKTKVNLYKKEGYTLYYEKIRPDVLSDSIAIDIAKRKTRKIIGLNGTYKENFDKAGVFKKLIQQPNNELLGADNNDVAADVTRIEFIAEWEKNNGPILLDSVDLNTNFKDNYKRKKFYTKKQRDNIILDYRNQHVVNLIKTGLHKKIIVIYGAAHRKGIKKLLQQKN